MTELLIRNADGPLEGRDPRELPLDALGELPGPLAAIRAKCIDCSAGNMAEVRRCVGREMPALAVSDGDQPAPGWHWQQSGCSRQKTSAHRLIFAEPGLSPGTMRLPPAAARAVP
jgi:hypothetical protein